MKSSPRHVVCMASWLITSLAAINVGLCPFGVNLLKSDWMMTRFPAFVTPLHYLVGLAGLVCLIAFVKACKGECDCGQSSCPSCKSGT